jgi:hypothetical protein
LNVGRYFASVRASSRAAAVSATRSNAAAAIRSGEAGAFKVAVPGKRSSLGMARVVPLNALREQALATALPPPRQGGAASFRPHPRAESVLAFASAFGRLKCAFHNDGQPSVAGAVC